MTLEIVFGILTFFIGTLFTSFFYLVSLRMPEKITILGHSECPKCHHRLSLFEVLPIFGYLFHLGKCRYCKERISIKYLLVEIIGGCFFLAGYLMYDFSLTFFVFLIAFSVLFISSVIDMTHRVVKDIVWVVGLIPLIVIRIIEGDFLKYLLSSVCLFLILYLLALFGKLIFKKDALGGGDIKLFLFIGFVLTLENGLLALVFSSLFGFLYGLISSKKRSQEIAFVPFISIGVLLAFLVGEGIIGWYLSLLGELSL